MLCLTQVFCSDFLESLERVFVDNDTMEKRIDEAKHLITQAIDEVSDMKRDLSVEWEGDDISPSKVTGSSGDRSIFSDVDL